MHLESKMMVTFEVCMVETSDRENKVQIHKAKS